MSYPSFAAGDILNASDMNAVGLWKVAELSFTNTTNPFINGCFTSNFQNYLVKITAQSNGGNADVSYRLRSGTSTTDNGPNYDRFGFYWAGSAINFTAANQTSGYATDATSVGTNTGVADLTFFRPNEAVVTVQNTTAWGANSGYNYLFSTRIETTTQYTGIELLTGTAVTITGTMRVYGFRN